MARKLKKFNLPQELLIQFYSAIIESVLCMSITVWFSSATKSDLRRLWRVVQTAERIIGTTLPTLQVSVISPIFSPLIQSKQKGCQNPRHLNIQHASCYRLVDATKLRTPERPDTGNCKIFTILTISSVLLLCVYTRYNLFAHSSCTSLFILLFIKSTVYFISYFTLMHILLFIFSSYIFFFNLYLYIFSCVVLHILHCSLSAPDLTYISLRIIFSIIEYVTNKKKP